MENYNYYFHRMSVSYRVNVLNVCCQSNRSINKFHFLKNIQFIKVNLPFQFVLEIFFKFNQTLNYKFSLIRNRFVRNKINYSKNSYHVAPDSYQVLVMYENSFQWDSSLI